MTCPGCGANIAADAPACASCGQAVLTVVRRPPERGTVALNASSLLGQEARLTQAPDPDTAAHEEPLADPGCQTQAELPKLAEILPARYKPIRKVGEGGMGSVYQCLDLALARPVAIKVMTERYRADPQGEWRFTREARAQAIVNHPNVATVLNFGVSVEGRPYLVMEYLEGQDLRALLRRVKLLEPLQACDLLRQTCEGLAEAHSVGLVHRDLKPSNLMIVRNHRGQPWVKILDLGLAKIMRSQTDGQSAVLDTMGFLVGTPAYMAPEQVAGGDIDGRADLYSMGVVLFEMLTGRLPFQSETLEGWLYQHVHVDITFHMSYHN